MFIYHFSISYLVDCLKNKKSCKLIKFIYKKNLVTKIIKKNL